ncbi:MAG: 2OG-Fe(II) oxygenase [Cyclobacteriaceae bacterium]|nr:2OG-Fe(II) oxygenase [Cyclobacteriaceae bacterium SS2]
MAFYNEDQWLSWIDQLSEDDHVVIDNFIEEGVYQTARSFLMEKLEDETFAKAKIGPGSEEQVVSEIRGDYIYWLDRTRDTTLFPFFGLIDETIQVLNRYCYLSLSGFEFHLAHYPAGSFYKRHLDQFKSRNNRMISMIIYLNEGWKPGNGGELKIFQDKGDLIVEPLARRCVLFKSDTVPHEVLKTQVSRYSLTGWLLYMPSGVGRILG